MKVILIIALFPFPWHWQIWSFTGLLLATEGHTVTCFRKTLIKIEHYNFFSEKTWSHSLGFSKTKSGGLFEAINIIAGVEAPNHQLGEQRRVKTLSWPAALLFACDRGTCYEVSGRFPLMNCNTISFPVFEHYYACRLLRQNQCNDNWFGADLLLIISTRLHKAKTQKNCGFDLSLRILLMNTHWYTTAILRTQ